MKDDDIIIIRHKLSAPAVPSWSEKVEVWHVLAVALLAAFVAGALIF